MRIGILTLPLIDNYGGILQCAALYNFLLRVGHEPILLTKKYDRPWHARLIGRILRSIPGHNIKNIRVNEARRALHYPFLDAFIPSRTEPLYNVRMMRRAVTNLNLECVIVGSDQVWRADYMSDSDARVFFLDLGISVKKIAYAASFGKLDWIKPGRLQMLRELIVSFDAVSVREKSGAEYCSRYFDRNDSIVALDPTMLVDPSFYDELGNSSFGKINFCLHYVLDDDSGVSEIVRQVFESDVTMPEIFKLTLDNGHDAIDMAQWVSAFRNSKFVITDSFHGTVFAILFRKPFISIANEERGVDRFVSLLEQLELTDRLVVKGERVDVKNVLQTKIDFDKVHEKLNEMRMISREFLQAALS